MEELNEIIDICKADVEQPSNQHGLSASNESAIKVTSYPVEAAPDYYVYIHSPSGSGKILNISRIINNGMDTDIPAPICKVKDISVYFNKSDPNVPLLMLISPLVTKENTCRYTYYCKNTRGIWVKYQTEDGNKLYNELPDLLDELHKNEGKLELDKTPKFKRKLFVCNSRPKSMFDDRVDLEIARSDKLGYPLLICLILSIIICVCIVIFIILLILQCAGLKMNCHW